MFTLLMQLSNLSTPTYFKDRKEPFGFKRKMVFDFGMVVKLATSEPGQLFCLLVSSADTFPFVYWKPLSRYFC